MKREGQVWREVDGLERVALITASEDLGTPCHSLAGAPGNRYYHTVLFLCWPVGDYRRETGHWSEDVPFEENRMLERVL